MIRQLSNLLVLRRLVSAFVTLTLVIFLGMSTPVVLAGNSLPTNDEIINLMLCYGTGTDAIGDSTRADPLGDGVAIYADCFTDDAVFRAWFPGTDFDDPGQAVTISPGGGMTGPENWAGFVFSVFDGTYTFTQHSLSNFIVDVQGDAGTLTAYLNAAHVTQEAGVVTAVAVAHGTYTLQVEKIDGGWRVSQLDIKLINFTPFF
jgi:hypothetical protein